MYAFNSLDAKKIDLIMKVFYDVCKLCGAATEQINQKFSLLKCESCKLVFSEFIFEQKDFEETYNTLYNAANPKYKTHSVIEYEQIKNGIYNIGYNRKRLINKYIHSDAKILEIGSGNGLVGCYIRNKFPQSTFTGIELDREIGEKARSFDLNIITGDFSVMQNIEEEYDFVLMWEVLEHIQDLKKCIHLIAKRLRIGGKFIFSVPNFEKRKNFKNYGDLIFQDGPPIHLNFFTEESIKEIFNSDEFQLLKIEKKKFPYFNLDSFKKMFLKIITLRYEGSTLFCVVEKV